MKKLTLLLVLVLLASCNNDDVTPSQNETTTPEQDVLSIAEINKNISAQLEVNGDMVWNDAQLLYSAAIHGGNMLTVGYGKKGQSFAIGGQKGTELLAAKKQLIETVTDMEPITEESVVVAADEILNVIEVKVSSLATVEALLKSEDVRYVEPNGYNHYRLGTAGAKKSPAGCDKGGTSLNSADYKRISPNALQPWNFDNHNIDKAWSISTGAGVTVGLIDTGLSSKQSMLGRGFNDGQSSGRRVERKGVFIDSPWFWSRKADGPNDKCGHGTTMAAALAAPRNDNNLPVGVAYNSNLVAYRAAEDVVIDDYHEKKGVSQALIELANRRDVKIISMSMGSLFSIGNVRDAIRYAHSKGKLIFTAGGTSTSFTSFVGVIFPASMSEVVAVTGVTDSSTYKKCGNCHSGYQIEFTIEMERASGTRNVVPTLAFNDGESKYTGGSSVATAMTAGIAALVWSKNPNWSRDQVLNKMRQSSDLYPNRNRQFGYGNIDALKAVQ